MTIRFIFKKTAALLMVCILPAYLLQAQPGTKDKTTVFTIFSTGDSLFKAADAVVRKDIRHLDIKDLNTATLRVHKIVTILNRNGNDLLSFSAYSDKFHRLDDAEIIVYNAFGKKLNSYRKKDMITTGYGEGLVEDGMLTYFNVTAASYPITIEQKYTVKYNGILEYPDYFLQTPGVALEQFYLEVNVPESIGLRHLELNTTIRPEKKVTNAVATYIWKASNLKALNRQSYSGPLEHYFPKIILSPNKFKISGYEGDMSSWKKFGLWSQLLIGDADQLNEKAVAHFIELTKNANTDAEKAAIIYHYLQKNMRYVSVQLGIGGWKPFTADFVHQKKYGDCKALSNYMLAALKAVGIKSYYAIVNSGANAIPVKDAFPSSAFNHVILCIPQAVDSIWLECTSNTADFGKLGYFTENRKALLITEEGGVLVSTPKSNAEDNVFSARTDITLAKDKATSVSVQIRGQGQFRQQQIALLYQKTNDDKLKYFMHYLNWQQPDEIEVKNGDMQTPVFTVDANMKFQKLYSFKAGNKFFFPSRLYDFFDEEVKKNNDRTQDYYFYGPYTVLDTTVYHCSADYGTDKLPAPAKLSNAFADYESNYLWDEDLFTLTVISKLKIKQQKVQADHYATLMAFKDKLDADRTQKIILITK